MADKKIGLALGSGGLRGLAHIGVIRAFEEKGFTISHLAGSSSGALVGASYSLFLDIDKVEDIFLSVNWKKIVSLLDLGPKKGLIKGEKTEKFIKELTEGASFSDLKIPFRPVATDIEKAEPVILKRGGLEKALRASCAFPMVFESVEIGGRKLLDGGLSIPVPVSVVKEMGAERVAAVNLDSPFHLKTHYQQKSYYNPGVYLEIMKIGLIRKELEKADLVIEPKIEKFNLKKLRRLFSEEAKKIINTGYEEALRVIQEP